MINRKTLAAIALATTAATSVPVFADDGDVQHARILLEQARGYGDGPITGQAAGQADARAERREAADSRDADQKRWRAIAKSQSLN